MQMENKQSNFHSLHCAKYIIIKHQVHILYILPFIRIYEEYSLNFINSIQGKMKISRPVDAIEY